MRTSLEEGTRKHSQKHVRCAHETYKLRYSSRAYPTSEGATKETKKYGLHTHNREKKKPSGVDGIVPWSHDTIVFKTCIYIVSASYTVTYPHRSSRVVPQGIKSGKGGKPSTLKHHDYQRNNPRLGLQLKLSWGADSAFFFLPAPASIGYILRQTHYYSSYRAAAGKRGSPKDELLWFRFRLASIQPSRTRSCKQFAHFTSEPHGKPPRSFTLASPAFSHGLYLPHLALCSLKRTAAEAGGAGIGGTRRVAGLSRPVETPFAGIAAEPRSHEEETWRT